MKIKNYIVVFFSVIGLGFTLQSDKELFTIKQSFNYFTTDNFNNTYLINGEEISKFNNAGKLFLKFSSKRYGNITSVDATNSLKILLYYKDFQQLIFLDSQLSQNGDAISLENLGYEQTDLACSSFNNSFWIYNKQNNELLRFNENSEVIAKTGNLKQILETDIKPNFMIEHNSYLYLNCPNNGVYVFDMYGTFNKIISIKNLAAFQVSNGILYFFNKKNFCSYDAKTFNEKCISYNDSLVKNVRIEKDRLYLQYTDSVKVLDNQLK